MKRTTSTSYEQAPFGACGQRFIDLMTELQGLGMRKDTERTAVLLAIAALSRTWPIEHFPRRERDQWPRKARAAFRVSETELAEVTGTSRARVHTALSRMLEAGLVVELSPLTHRGEGRGTTPPTYALKCHLAEKATSSGSVDSGSLDSESADENSSPAGWDIGARPSGADAPRAEAHTL